MKQIFNTLFLSFLILNSLKSQVPDSSFNKTGKQEVGAGYGDNIALRSLLRQPNGKILLGGYVSDQNFYYPQINVFRINENGTVDSAFGSQGTVSLSGSPYGASEYGGAIALQPDGKIVGVGTDFDRNGGLPNYLVLFRLKPDGKYDPTFGKNGRAYFNFGNNKGQGNALVVKSDGKIVVTGYMPIGSSGSRNIELVQFLPNGKIDSSFGTKGFAAGGLPVSPTGWTLLLLPGDKILAAFSYSFGGASKTGVVKYNANGTVDTTFGYKGVATNNNINASVDFGSIGLAIQQDGKILEYASVDKGDGNSSNILYRYNANGTPDNSFRGKNYIILPFFSYGQRQSVTVDASKRILLNGDPNDFYVQGYLPNGKIDPSFGVNGVLRADFTDIDPYAVGYVEGILVQPDSKIVAAGLFFDGGGIGEIVTRFKNVATLKQQPATANLPADNTDKISVYPNPVNDVLNINGLKANAVYDLKITDAKGNLLAAKKVNDAGLINWNVQNLRSGFYYLNISFNGQTRTFQFLKK